MHKDAVAPGTRVLIVDDLLATGGNVRRRGAHGPRSAAERWWGLGFVVELTFLKGRDKLAGYEVFSLLQYDE